MMKPNGEEEMTLTWNRAAKDVRNLMSSDRIIYYHILVDVITQIRSSLDLKTTLQTATAQIRHVLDTDRVAIFQFYPDLVSQGRVVYEDVRSPWKPAATIDIIDHCFGEQFAQEYMQGRIGAIGDIRSGEISECYRQILEQFQVRANLVCALSKGDRLWGLLCIHQCSRPREWTPTEIEFIGQISQQLSVAIQQSELLQKSKNQAEELQTTLVQLQKTQAQMIQTEKMVSLGHLVAGVAHEINNPISFIAGNLNYVEQYANDLLAVLDGYQQAYPDPVTSVKKVLEKYEIDFVREDLPETLASMKQGAKRIQHIVKLLRSFSRLDEAELKDVDIHEGIDSTLTLFNHRLESEEEQEGERIQIVKNYSQLPSISCYPAQLNQVFMYLIGNALDSLDDSHSSHPIIEITTEIENDEITISIRDNGLGIPESIQAYIFDPFFTTKPPGKGRGLGLSISYQIIVEQHQGDLRFESLGGQGTTFSIKLPRKAHLR
ncbi:sensor histidine kinase [Roseofilum casamattae]|uniref:histidine kinase n=1 Tax=Roseofilum casamattae BLCC-M143 TaxID=3022442 RepID=A0ABT7C1A4_9CYAN|nr:ATP-binding protein [Roseofilum casamattae]MDJ1185237.1 ATP-binding protein [Roseofilum casamattae BLCC-M143]